MYRLGKAMIPEELGFLGHRPLSSSIPHLTHRVCINPRKHTALLPYDIESQAPRPL
jgi:hypothetical protein